MQLQKRKSRLTFETSAEIRERGKYRPVVVQAEPDFARIRLKGMKHYVDVSWEGIYHFASKVAADRARTAKKIQKRDGRKK